MYNIDQLFENLFTPPTSGDIIGGIKYNRIVPDVDIFPIMDLGPRSLIHAVQSDFSPKVSSKKGKTKSESTSKLTEIPVQSSIPPLIVPQQSTPAISIVKPDAKPITIKTIAPVTSIVPKEAVQQNPVTELAFTLEDFSKSWTAKKYKIDNSIPTDLEENANQMLEILNDIQDKWGSKIILNSGYRTKALNDRLKGSSKTSAHMSAFAMDIKPANGKFNEFTKFMKDYVKDKDFDQLIVESSNNGKSKWIHFGLKASGDRQRKQIFNINL